MYNQELLEKNIFANCGRSYQQCSISVMDTISDPDITFDTNGICNYYSAYKKDEAAHVLNGENGNERLIREINKIKNAKGTRKYDSILGLSGGVDSTYLCLLAKEQGLNPLVVHCDNGWNSELAQHNIEQTVKKCGFDLFTYVINWNEFKSMQLAYLKASVVDIEVLTDHAFMAVLYEQARKWKIKYVLAGMNIVTEQVLPKYWIYNKSDDKNIKDIVNKYGDIKINDLKTFPFLSYTSKMYCHKLLKLEVITPLNWIEYNYDKVKERIITELGWRDYGGKHYESVWTRFYQGYILPNKFNIDKRKAHFSNLIFSGQITKKDALEKLQTPILPYNIAKDDLAFVIKKFGLTDTEFHQIMNLPRREHSEFLREVGFRKSLWLFKILNWIKNK
jgi:N-acetyl sugar amidotransferase